MNKKILYLIIVVAVVSFFGYKFVNEKMTKIELGLARSTFPFKDYTGDELNELFPQVMYADVPTRVTPEETYAKFREALKNNDLKGAVARFGMEASNYDEVIKMLNDFYNEGKFLELYNYYPELIEQDSMYESIAQYKFEYYSSEYGQNLIGNINFVKNSEGDWKLSSL